jgi:hypothetical protein
MKALNHPKIQGFHTGFIHLINSGITEELNELKASNSSSSIFIREIYSFLELSML